MLLSRLWSGVGGKREVSVQNKAEASVERKAEVLVERKAEVLVESKAGAVESEGTANGERSEREWRKGEDANGEKREGEGGKGDETGSEHGTCEEGLEAKIEEAMASPLPFDPPAPVRRVYNIPLDSNETGESSVAFQLTRHKDGIDVFVKQTFPHADPVDYKFAYNYGHEAFVRTTTYSLSCEQVKQVQEWSHISDTDRTRLVNGVSRSVTEMADFHRNLKHLQDTLGSMER